jgi:hypothetical protein
MIATLAMLLTVVEIRSYNLKPGARDRFHEIATTQAIPMLRRSKIDVVANGPSLHDANSYYLIRAFASPEERDRQEDAFYASDEWRQGPREAVLSAIESYTTVVVRIDPQTLEGLRHVADGPSTKAAAAAELAAAGRPQHRLRAVDPAIRHAVVRRAPGARVPVHELRWKPLHGRLGAPAGAAGRGGAGDALLRRAGPGPLS